MPPAGTADTLGMGVLTTENQCHVVSMSREGAVHVLVNLRETGRQKEVHAKTPVVPQALAKVVLPIEDLQSCSPSDTLTQ